MTPLNLRIIQTKIVEKWLSPNKPKFNCPARTKTQLRTPINRDLVNQRQVLTTTTLKTPGANPAKTPTKCEAVTLASFQAKKRKTSSYNTWATLSRFCNSQLTWPTRLPMLVRTRRWTSLRIRLRGLAGKVSRRGGKEWLEEPPHLFKTREISTS